MTTNRATELPFVQVSVLGHHGTRMTADDQSIG